MSKTINPNARRRQLLGMAGSLPLLPLASLARADEPAPPLRMVLPLPAGGAADAVIRILSARMKDRFGRTVIVDNRPGASGTLAMQQLAMAPADGNTLCFVHVGMLSAQLLLKRFDLAKQCAPITTTGEGRLVLAVPGNSPFKTFEDLRAFAAKNLGKLSYGSIGIGSLEHVTTESMSQLAGIKTNHVPYKGGPEVVQAIAASEIDFTFLIAQVVLPFAEKGQLRVLASLTEQPQKVLPGVPTVQSLKLPVRTIGFWGGLCAPAGTPAPVVARLHQQISAIMQEPDIQERIRILGSEPIHSASPEAFAARIQADLKWMEGVIAANRIEIS